MQPEGCFKEGNERETQVKFFCYHNTLHMAGSAERNIPKTLARTKKCVGGKMVSQVFNYITPVSCHMSFSLSEIQLLVR